MFDCLILYFEMLVVQIDTLMDKWTRWMKAKMAGCRQMDGWMDG